MSRPWKHPNSGVYWLRKGVPEDLRALVGKREEKRSLQTRDPAEAKRRHAEALAEIESRWASLRVGPKTLTEIEAHQMAAVVHDRWLQQHQDNPSQQTSWRTDLGDRLFAPPKFPTMDEIRGGTFLTDIDLDAIEVLKMEKWCLEVADGRLAAHGLVVDDQSRRKLAVAIGIAVQRASLTLARLAKGEIFSSAALFPAHSKSAAPADTRPLTFKFLVDGWSTERRPVAKTVYEWSRVVRQLEEYLGHSDARQLTGQDLVGWKSSMVEAGLRPKTIQDAKLAPMRAILQWGVNNKHLASNPADGISLDVRSKQGEKKRSFTDAEAKIVLKAALGEKDPVRRWVPWLGAYSGAGSCFMVATCCVYPSKTRSVASLPYPF